MPGQDRAYDFYKNFVVYGGPIPKNILSSWEFADRIENLDPYWSPVQWDRIEKTRKEAEKARLEAGVEYVNPLVYAPMDWFDVLVAGGDVSVSSMNAYDSEAGSVSESIYKALAKTGMTVRLKYRFDRDHHTAKGTLVRYEKVFGTDMLLLENVRTPEVLKRQQVAGLKWGPVPAKSVTSVQVIDPPETLRRRLRDHLRDLGWNLNKMSLSVRREYGVRPTAESLVSATQRERIKTICLRALDTAE